MNPLAYMFAVAAVMCFVAMAFGWSKGYGLGLAALTVALVLIPQFRNGWN